MLPHKLIFSVTRFIFYYLPQMLRRRNLFPDTWRSQNRKSEELLDTVKIFSEALAGEAFVTAYACIYK